MLKGQNGLTLSDLVNHANALGLDVAEIYLISSDGSPIVEVDSESYSKLWFLGDLSQDVE